KKPWAVAAAGLLLIGLAGGALGNYLDVRPYKAPAVLAAMDRANNAAKDAQAAEDAFNRAKKAAQDEEEAVKAIVAGQSERLNWIKRRGSVSDCTPQPDGSNLPPEVRDRYFEPRPERVPAGTIAMSGREAYEEYRRRIHEGIKAPEEGKERKE